MLNKVFAILCVLLVVVGCTVACAADCGHTKVNIFKEEGWYSVSDTFHEYQKRYDVVCTTCNTVETNGAIVRVSVDQHTLVSSYDYHNGDQPEHIFVYYCSVCGATVRRFVACNGNIDGEGCVTFR